MNRILANQLETFISKYLRTIGAFTNFMFAFKNNVRYQNSIAYLIQIDKAGYLTEISGKKFKIQPLIISSWSVFSIISKVEFKQGFVNSTNLKCFWPTLPNLSGIIRWHLFGTYLGISLDSCLTYELHIEKLARETREKKKREKVITLFKN